MVIGAANLSASCTPLTGTLSIYSGEGNSLPYDIIIFVQIIRLHAIETCMRVIINNTHHNYSLTRKFTYLSVSRILSIV